jgi:hypothetical protein
MAILPTITGSAPLNVSDNVYTTFTIDIAETLTNILNDTPADFASMDNLTFTVEYSLTTPRTDDVYSFLIRIVNGATILAAADAGGTFTTVSASVTSTIDTTTGPTAWGYVNTLASKATWDGATIELQQGYAKTKGGDGTSIRVDTFSINGNYTAGVAAQIITGAAFVDPDLFGAGTIVAGVATITGATFIDPDLFGTGTVLNQDQFITGATFSDPDVFGSGTISQPIASDFDFLFNAAEQGAIYDPSVITSLWTDTAATVQVATPGDIVARIDDLSGNGNNATQATLANRPIYAIEPAGGRRNLFTFTEDLNNAAWSKFDVSFTAAAIADPDGGTTATTFSIAPTGSYPSTFRTIPVTSATPHTLSVYAKAGTLSVLSLEFRGSNTAPDATFNLTTGTVATGTGAIIGVGNGWFRCSITVTTVDASEIAIIGGGVSPGTGDLYLWHPQIEESATASNYQKVVSQYLITEAGVTSVSYLDFDGINDAMSTGAIDFSAADEVSTFSGIRKLRESSSGTLFELSADANITNGCFAVFAPSGLNRYAWLTRGSVTATALVTDAAFDSPVSTVITASSKISTDICTLRLDGVSLISTATDQGAGNFSAANTLFIGARGGNTLRAQMHLYGLVIRGKLSTGTEEADAESAMALKSGVTIGAGVQTINGTTFSDPDVFPAGIVTAGGVAITGATFIDPDVFGSGSVVAGVVTIAGATFSDPDAFGAGTVSAGAAFITGAVFVDPDVFGSGTITAGAVAITGATFIDPDAFGGGTVTQTTPGQVITGAAFADPDAFGAGTVSPGVVAITGATFADPDAFGSGNVSVSGGAQFITGATYVNASTFGASSVTTISAITGAKFNDPDTFPGSAVSASYNITGAILIDPDAFGSGSVSTASVISGATLIDPDAFGSGNISIANSPQAITGATYSDPDAFGASSVTTQTNLTGAALVDPDSFGPGTVTQQALGQSIGGAAFSDPDAFGGGSVASIYAIGGTDFADPDVFGAGLVLVGGVTITGAAFISVATFGAGSFVTLTTETNESRIYSTEIDLRKSDTNARQRTIATAARSRIA